jgi:hypothetical protein
LLPGREIALFDGLFCSSKQGSSPATGIIALSLIEQRGRIRSTKGRNA